MGAEKAKGWFQDKLDKVLEWGEVKFMQRPIPTLPPDAQDFNNFLKKALDAKDDADLKAKKLKLSGPENAVAKMQLLELYYREKVEFFKRRVLLIEHELLSIENSQKKINLVNTAKVREAPEVYEQLEELKRNSAKFPYDDPIQDTYFKPEIAALENRLGVSGLANMGDLIDDGDDVSKIKINNGVKMPVQLRVRALKSEKQIAKAELGFYENLHKDAKYWRDRFEERGATIKTSKSWLNPWKYLKTK